MSEALHRSPSTPLDVALETLVARGTITVGQRDEILAEVAGGPATPTSARTAVPTSPPLHRRALTDILVEVGLYVGSALVLAAAFALVAQAWEDLAQITQVTILGAVALLTGIVGWVLSHAATAGSARRRLAGVVMTATAASAAGAVAVAMGDSEVAGVVALATAVVIMVAAWVRAASAITEIGLFVASFALLNVAGEWLRPEQVGYQAYSTYDRLMSLGAVAFGLLWALLIARRMMHRELAVALGVGVAFVSAMPLAGEPASRPYGLAALALLAAVGFWRYMAEGLWPWLVAAIGSVTAFVFWAVGVQRNPALAFLVAGLVLLGSSALGWQVARHRRSAPIGSGPPAPPALT